MAVTTEAYLDLAAACQARARERDTAEIRVLDLKIAELEHRCAIAAMLGLPEEDGIPPEWPVLLTRLRERLCTANVRPKLPA